MEDIARIKTEGFEAVINCTSLGMSPNVNDSPVPPSLLSSGMTVFDTVYNPIITKLLKQGAEVGAKTINGLEMFIEQAVEQYSILTKLEPNRQTIEAVLREKFMA